MHYVFIINRNQFVHVASSELVSVCFYVGLTDPYFFFYLSLDHVKTWAKHANSGYYTSCSDALCARKAQKCSKNNCFLSIWSHFIVWKMLVWHKNKLKQVQKMQHEILITIDDEYIVHTLQIFSMPKIQLVKNFRPIFKEMIYVLTWLKLWVLSWANNYDCLTFCQNWALLKMMTIFTFFHYCLRFTLTA